MSDVEGEDDRPNKRRRVDQNAETQSDGTLEGQADESGASSRPNERQEQLSERLRKVMLCSICLELPTPDESYQCSLGHIVCEDCVTRLLAEATMSRRGAQCPHCRTHISWKDLSKNLVVGQALAEMPKSCPDCDQVVEYDQLENHMKTECTKRQVICKNRCLGCEWSGSQAESVSHEADCHLLNKSSDEIMKCLNKADAAFDANTEQLFKCFRILSYHRISYEDLDLRWPVHFFRMNTEVRFKSTTIDAFENSWRLRMKLTFGRDSDCDITFCIRLLTVPREELTLKYFLTLPAAQVQPKQLMDVRPHLMESKFSRSGQSSDFMPLVMNGPKATYRLLAMSRICLRIWMVLE